MIVAGCIIFAETEDIIIWLYGTTLQSGFSGISLLLSGRFLFGWLFDCIFKCMLRSMTHLVLNFR
jgi:hypothetical protein